MKAIGNLNDYTRMKAADALGTAAANPGGLGSAGVGVGAGFGLGGLMADSLRQGMQGGSGGGGLGGGGSGDGGGSAPAGRSVADQLRDIAALHKEGILSDEEFAAKKSDLLKKL